jgi:hypothetical protein
MKGAIMTVFVPSAEDLITLAGAILACGILAASFWITYEWVKEMLDDEVD